MVPEQDPERYLPLPQLALEHASLSYALVVPLQVPERYFPSAQLMLEQVEHAVSEEPEHPPLLYLPVPHVAHVLHVPADVEE